MNCEKASLLIEELYDGDLEGQIKNRLEEHVVVCSFCRVKFENVCKLDRLLDAGFAIPQPSILLDQKLMNAFKAKHRPYPEKRETWRQWMFGGSISIPKPVFAALSVLIAITFLTAGIMLKRNANPVTADFASAAVLNVSTSPSPEIIERIKVVEVPVVKEQIVTRVVYVEKKNFADKRKQKQSQLSITTSNNPKKSFQHLPVEINNSAAKSSVAENRHITRVNLDGFQPAVEPKVRVIREENANENNEK